MSANSLGRPVERPEPTIEQCERYGLDIWTATADDLDAAVLATPRPQPVLTDEAGAAPEREVRDEETQIQEWALATYPRLDWQELWDETPAEIDWMVEPLLERGRSVALFAPAKAGKSLLTLEISAGLASGRPVLGNPARPPIPVLYVDLENLRGDVKDRLSALGYEPEDLGNLYYLTFPNLPALDSAQGGKHLDGVARAYGAEVVIIDTLSRVVTGEEDASTTYRDFYRHTISPLRARGVTVLRLDHSGKDLSRGQRGSSAKADDVDAVWQLTVRSQSELILQRTHDRTGHGSDRVDLRRRFEPLRHELQGETASPVSILIATLDRLEVPNASGRDRAREMLRAAGEGASTTDLAAAVATRKGRLALSPEPRTGGAGEDEPAATMTCPEPLDSAAVLGGRTCPGQVQDSQDSSSPVPGVRPVRNRPPLGGGQVGPHPPAEVGDEETSRGLGRSSSPIAEVWQTEKTAHDQAGKERAARKGWRQ